MKGVKGYIYSHPENDRCVFSGGSRIIRSNPGSSGVAKNTLEFPRSGSSSVEPDHPAWPFQSLTKPQVRIIGTKAGSFGLT